MGYPELERRSSRCPSAVPLRLPRSSASSCSSTATMTPSPTSASAAPPCSRSPTARRPMPWPAPACSARATPTPSTPGSTTTSTRGSRACWPAPRGATAGAGPDRRAELEAWLRRGPGPYALQGGGSGDGGLWRWTLRTIQAHCAWLRDYTPSGVWRLLDRWALRLRSAAVQQFSPDPEYDAKVADLEMALWEARRYPRSVVAVFLDQMGVTRL